MQHGSKFQAPRRPGLWREYRHFLRHHPAWYLVPIAAVLAAVAWAVLSDRPPEVSFIYPIF